MKPNLFDYVRNNIEEQIGEVEAFDLKEVQDITNIAMKLYDMEKQKKNAYKIGGSKDVFDYTRKDFGSSDVEVYGLITLNSNMEVINFHELTKGGINQTVINPQGTLKCAINDNAVSAIMVHNHPSGNVTPSTEDILITNKMGRVFSLIGIKLQDHVIVTSHDFSSLRQLQHMQDYSNFLDDLEKYDRTKLFEPGVKYQIEDSITKDTFKKEKETMKSLQKTKVLDAKIKETEELIIKKDDSSMFKDVQNSFKKTLDEKITKAKENASKQANLQASKKERSI